MIVWNGWGILVVPIVMVFTMLGGATVGELTGNDDASLLGAAAGVALSAIPVFLLGRYMNRPLAGYDPRTGQPTYFTNRHKLFFVPMQFWGFILLVISAIVVVAVLV